MKTLITGAAGYIAGNITKRMVEKNKPIKVFVRETEDLRLLKKLNIEMCFGALQDKKSIEKAMNGVDRIIHCAAYVSDWGNKKDFYEANVLGVKNMVEEAIKTKKIKKFTHISTTDVYGSPSIPVDENAPLIDNGPHYPHTKIQGEHVVWEAYRTHALPITIIRPGTVIGPGKNIIITELIHYLKKGILFIDDGKLDAGLVFIDNLVEGIINATFQENTTGQAYNMLDNYQVTFRKFIQDIAAGLHISYKSYNVSFSTAYKIACALEYFYLLLPRRFKPPLTREAVFIMGRPQNHSTEKAKKDILYQSTIRYEECIKRILHQIND